jgi:hypothetical protein
MSLKSILLSEIKNSGSISLQGIYNICDREGRKHDNGSRRLRELSHTGLIEKITEYAINAVGKDS